MPLSLLLALRFLRSSSQEKTISVMIKICFFSILIGTCALTLVAAIMNGFEEATSKKLQGIHSDITINAYDQAIDYEKLKKVLDTEYANTIQAASPTSINQIIIQTSSNETQAYTICLLKAVDPAQEQKVSKLASMITTSGGGGINNDTSIHKTSGKKSSGGAGGVWDLLSGDAIFIGEALAEQLHVKVGDRVTLLYPEQGALSHKVALEEKEVTVGALFKTGIHDFDEHVIVASFGLARQLYPSPISQVSITLKDPRQEQAVIESLKKRLSLSVVSWKDLYPSLVSALLLEKYVMLFILLLVTLVASLNIISLLFMYVAQKRTEIAILKTMGMTDRSLMSIFMILSACVSLTATTCGILLALFATFLLNRFPFIELPDVYYVTHLPATLSAPILCSIVILALIVSIIAALVPARKIKTMMVAQILKSIA